MMKYQNSILMLLLLVISVTRAQSDGAVTEVEAKVDALYEAMVGKDEAALKNLTAEELSYGHSSGAIENKAQFIEAVMNGPFDYLSITPEEQQITVSGNVALVRHIFVTNATNAGAPVDIRIGNFMAFQNQDGEWKLLGRQAFKLP